MHSVERCLLYCTSVVLALVLIFDSGDRSAESKPTPMTGAETAGSASHPAAPGTTPASEVSDEGPLAAPESVQEPALPEVAEATPGGERRSIVLTDAAGRPRLELTVADAGVPQILLKDENGLGYRDVCGVRGAEVGITPAAGGAPQAGVPRV